MGRVTRLVRRDTPISAAQRPQYLVPLMDLKREDILEGRVEEAAMEAERLGIFRRMTPAERAESKRDILSVLPSGEDVWLLATAP